MDLHALRPEASADSMQGSLNESSVRPNGTPVISLLRSRKTQKFLKFVFEI